MLSDLKRLRSKPHSATRESQQERLTFVDMLRPKVTVTNNDGVDGLNGSSNQTDEQPEYYIMPHRVFPPISTSQVEQSQQPTAHGIVDRSARSEFNNTMYTYSQFSPGIADPNSINDFTHRYQSTSAHDFTAAQMQQYPQFNLHSVPTTIAMTLQQQIDILTERNGLSDHQAQSSAHGYPTSISMQSPSAIQEGMSTHWREGFVSMPNESYTASEAFQRSIQYQPTFGTWSNLSLEGTRTTGQGPVRQEAKADVNETIDLQSLFNKYDAN